MGPLGKQGKKLQINGKKRREKSSWGRMRKSCGGAKLGRGSEQEDHSRGWERQEGEASCPRDTMTHSKKEKTMEEQSKPEQELSEEQLGKISGGCLECEADKSKYQYHFDRILDGYEGLRNAASRYDVAAIDQIAASILMHQNQIDQFRVAQRSRELTPGHVAIQPGEPGYFYPTDARR
jgi:hypothetical protein